MGSPKPSTARLNSDFKLRHYPLVRESGWRIDGTTGVSVSGSAPGRFKKIDVGVSIQELTLENRARKLKAVYAISGLTVGHTPLASGNNPAIGISEDVAGAPDLKETRNRLFVTKLVSEPVAGSEFEPFITIISMKVAAGLKIGNLPVGAEISGNILIFSIVPLGAALTTGGAIGLATILGFGPLPDSAVSNAMLAVGAEVLNGHCRFVGLKFDR